MGAHGARLWGCVRVCVLVSVHVCGFNVELICKAENREIMRKLRALAPRYIVG